MMTALSTARPAYGLEGPSAGRTVDNAIPQGSTYRRGNFVQSNGAGSEGLIDEVIEQLMSGKEATVYVVRCGDAIRCAKVYKDATQRSFRKSASYQEGRKVKNSRQARAMEKGSRYGRKMQEEVWQNAEVDALYRLASAGVRVPQPHICFEGVLLMDLVVDAEGNPAPRLNDVELEEELALKFHLPGRSSAGAVKPRRPIEPNTLRP